MSCRFPSTINASKEAYDLNHSRNDFDTPDFQDQGGTVHAMSFKDVASFLGIGEMTAYQDEQKVFALLRKTFPTQATLLSAEVIGADKAAGHTDSCCLHPPQKNWFPVDQIVSDGASPPCLTTTAIVFQLLYRKNERYRPAVFEKQQGCWREIALVRRLVFCEGRLTAQLDHVLVAFGSDHDRAKLGVRIELEQGDDAHGPFSLPVPTAFFVTNHRAKEGSDAT